MKQKVALATGMDHKTLLNRLTPAGMLITLGIVFGDIGTSPLYVMKAIIGAKVVTETLVLGGISCVFWTLTFQTTLKYVLLTLRADNRGEGGILSLYALVRRRGRWLVIPAIIGGSALLADGIITPPISVTSAIEGLNIIYSGIPVVQIVIVILVGLFLFQRFGTQIVGKLFGPIMLVWFIMLAVLGISQIVLNPMVLKAFSPWYAIEFLRSPGGFWLLGAVFLCTTGAEALYSDLGHCGRRNIQGSWVLVKTCLLLNYFGQGAYLLQHMGHSLENHNPFFYIMPEWFRLSGIIIATAATIIASQALISGSYTLVSEAMRLNLWPKVRLRYPNNLRGQLYIPSTNFLLMLGCIGVVLFFQSSEAMEAAYGLAITITMLSTTTLLYFYMRFRHIPVPFLFSGLFLFIELAFLVANLEKFPNGGYISLLIGFVIFTVMWIWFKARRIKNRYKDFVKLEPYLPMLKELSEDEGVPKYATNLVYLTSADFQNEIEQKIVYSLFNKLPKRADTYWFIHVDVMDDPHTQEYKVLALVPGKVYKIDFKLGFRVAPRINLYFRKVVEKLTADGEVNVMSRYDSLKKHNIVGDFRFIIIERILNYDYYIPAYERFIMSIFIFLKDISLSEEKAFGLDTSLVSTEKAPLIAGHAEELEQSLHRID